MKLSANWLKCYVDIDVTPKEYAARMTMSGSKVEGYESAGEGIENVVVGRLLSVTPHPNADKLVICSVDVGKGEPIQIVTGAKNVKAGDIIPVCLNGAKLPSGTVIKKGKLRGVESNGMLCSLSELGLTVSDFPYAIEDGIFIIEEPCEIGQDIKSALGLDDTITEFEITSNRPDCLSVIGLARETAATFGLKADIKEPVVKGNGGNVDDYVKVTVEAPDLCPRYCARAVKNIKIGPSPRWMRERLRHSGVRPINNIVDITNYVMLEYGQPMHAFDRDYIGGKHIIVRRAKDGENIVTLDGQTRKLDSSVLMIADDEKSIGIAGVMGGENSEIKETTGMIIFESANFDAATVRRGAKKVGLRTEASGRFEKGLDPNISLLAINRACELVEQLGCGEVVDGIIDINHTDSRPRVLPFEPDKINSFLGAAISREDQEKILRSLYFEVTPENNITVPTFRGDVQAMADVAEEVARIYGYNSIASTVFKGESIEGRYTPVQKLERKLIDTVASLGLFEMCSYSFISPKEYDKLAIPANSNLRKSVVITNPLGEDTSVMRTTALPSLLEALSLNYNRRNPKAALFELAKIFLPGENADTLPEEKKVLTAGMYGSGDFYVIKGIIIEALRTIGIEGVETAPLKTNPCYHPGRCAVLTKGDAVLGVIGQIHPTVADNYEIEVPVYAAEIDFNTILSLNPGDKTYKPLPKFPAVTRDIAVLCDEELPVASIEKIICETAKKILESCSLFDVYKGKQIEAGKKSVAYSVVLRAEDRTLTDAETENVMKKIITRLEKELGCILRS
ncbi:MAG: phenylalanine--tRNA ligase subunit beta [Bacillota bacterium]|nr:phenylalanine--tRNA ligase subunit beta [Bacillota bacterium]